MEKPEWLVHFVSTGPKFPYMYYIGLMTALKVYGDKVRLWITEEPKSEYFEILKGNVTINKIPAKDIPEFPALRNKDDHFRRVAIFDYLIWDIVYKYGGMIMGLDSITLKPHFDLLEAGKELMAPRDREERPKSFSMHGVVVRKGSELAGLIISDAKKALNSPNMIWGESGIRPFITRSLQNLDKISIAPPGICGLSSAWDVPAILYVFNDDGFLPHADTRTMPLYASSSAPTDVTIDEQYVAVGSSLYARLIKSMLSEEEWNPLKKTIKWFKVLNGEGKADVNKVCVKKQKRFHLLGLAHLATNKEEACACAYSQKCLKMGKMLKSSGHKVFFYGVEGSTVKCDEFIQVSSKETLRATYGDYDYKSEMYKFDTKDLAYKTFDANAIREINKRKQDDDFLLVPFGWGEKAIADAVGLYLTVESGIGYEDTFAPFRVFESYAWMHYIYGRDKVNDGRFYDCVIPNYFDPKDFKFSSKKEDYFLYLGRLIKRKGVQIAKEMVEAIGGRLVLAGQKGTGQDFIDLSPSYMEYVGFVNFKERKKLLSRAKAVLVPTTYIGPFEGVSIEAAFSGTPVIATDFGCFAENILDQVTGFRCRTLDDFIWAAKNIKKIKPRDCRNWAMKNFTLERIAPMYDHYFDMLMTLFDKGWYQITENKNERYRQWLKKWYPK